MVGLFGFRRRGSARKRIESYIPVYRDDLGNPLSHQHGSAAVIILAK